MINTLKVMLVLNEESEPKEAYAVGIDEEGEDMEEEIDGMLNKKQCESLVRMLNGITQQIDELGEEAEE